MTESHPGMLAVRAAAPTSRHAEMLLEIVTELLGELAYVETAPQGAERRVFRRDRKDPELVIPWPLLRLRYGGRTVIEMDMPGVELVPAPLPQRRAPRLRGLRAGTLEVQNGTERIEIAYGEDGGWFETCVSGGKSPLTGLAVTVDAEPGNAVDSLAERIAGLDEARAAPGRVYMPDSASMGVEEVWQVGLPLLRRVLFRGLERPEDARWVAIDVPEGTHIGQGAAAGDALFQWWNRLAGIDADEIEVGSDEEARDDWPEKGPHIPDVPGALIKLPLPPLRPPPVGVWVRLVGSCGRTGHAALVHERDGFMLIGEQVVAAFDRRAINERLATADREHAQRVPPFERSADLPRLDCRLTTYRLLEEPNGLAVAPSVELMQERVGFDAGDLDGDRVACGVLRQRRLA